MGIGLEDFQGAATAGGQWLKLQGDDKSKVVAVNELIDVSELNLLAVPKDQDRALDNAYLRSQLLDRIRENLKLAGLMTETRDGRTGGEKLSFCGQEARTDEREKTPVQRFFERAQAELLGELPGQSARRETAIGDLSCATVRDLLNELDQVKRVAAVKAGQYVNLLGEEYQKLLVSLKPEDFSAVKELVEFFNEADCWQIVDTDLLKARSDEADMSLELGRESNGPEDTSDKDAFVAMLPGALKRARQEQPAGKISMATWCRAFKFQNPAEVQNPGSECSPSCAFRDAIKARVRHDLKTMGDCGVKMPSLQDFYGKMTDGLRGKGLGYDQLLAEYVPTEIRDGKKAVARYNLKMFELFARQHENAGNFYVRLSGDGTRLESAGSRNVFRGFAAINENNRVRELLLKSVVDHFGSKEKIPESVRMELTNFDGGGHPLSAKRIGLIANAIANADKELKFNRLVDQATDGLMNILRTTNPQAALVRQVKSEFGTDKSTIQGKVAVWLKEKPGVVDILTRKPKEMSADIKNAFQNFLTDCISNAWGKIGEESRNTGYAHDFVRCQVTPKELDHFTLDGVPASEVRILEDKTKQVTVDGYTTKEENASILQWLEKNVPDKNIRAFATTQLGLEGLSGIFSEFVMQNPGEDLFGYGNCSKILANPDHAFGKFSVPASRKFDLSVKDGCLIVEQKINAAPPILTVNDILLNEGDAFTISENVLTVKMAIPLNQKLEKGDPPKFAITFGQNSEPEDPSKDDVKNNADVVEEMKEKYDDDNSSFDINTNINNINNVNNIDNINNVNQSPLLKGLKKLKG